MMKKTLKFGSPIVTITLFVLAGILLLGSSIGGARAALTYFSEDYRSQISMYDIGVSLMEKYDEKDERVSWRDYEQYSDGEWDKSEMGKLLKDRWSEDNPIKPGVAYEERIYASNTGTIDEYVRITLYTYWEDANGNKRTDLSPDTIELHLDPDNLGSAWLEDTAASQATSTNERRVFYYNRILPAKESTPYLTDTLTVSGYVVDLVTTTKETFEKKGITYTKYTTTYDYDGANFVIEAAVDAVQTHNAEDAILSAWGRKVSIDSNGYLTLR